METTLSKTTRYVLAAAFLAAGVNCGSQSGPTAPSASPAGPSPVAQPAPELPSEIVPAASGGIPGVHRVDATMSRSGLATVTLRWQNGDFSLQLYVTKGGCADVTTLLAGLCAVSGRTRPGDRPGVVTSQVTGGDLHSIWVLNPDHAPQPFTLETKIE